MSPTVSSTTSSSLHVLPSFSNRRHATTAAIGLKQLLFCQVVVTGAGGRTGGLIIKQLLEKADNSVVGTVRSKASSSKLQFDAEKASLVELDLAAAAAAAAADNADNPAVKEFAAALQGADALVIATRWVALQTLSCNARCAAATLTALRLAGKLHAHAVQLDAYLT